MTKTQPRTIACPKCAGTGIVSHFLDHDGGVCYDCNGNGTIAATPVSTSSNPLKAARQLGDAALADPTSVPAANAAEAFAVFEALHRTQWNQRDYDRRNALLTAKDAS